MPAAGFEHGVGEATAGDEVRLMTDQIVGVLLEAQLGRPGFAAEARCRADVLDTGGAGGVVSLAVLRAERFEHEPVCDQSVGNRELVRHETAAPHHEQASRP